MAETCVFRDRQNPPCSQPATHRVVITGWPHPGSTWRIEEALEPRTDLAGVTADIQAEHGHQVPEFCLRHAGDVMDQRNTAGRPR